MLEIVINTVSVCVHFQLKLHVSGYGWMEGIGIFDLKINKQKEKLAKSCSLWCLQFLFERRSSNGNEASLLGGYVSCGLSNVASGPRTSTARIGWERIATNSTLQITRPTSLVPERRTRHVLYTFLKHFFKECVLRPHPRVFNDIFNKFFFEHRPFDRLTSKFTSISTARSHNKTLALDELVNLSIKIVFHFK